MALRAETGVSATDRLGFTIFVALAVHVLIVLTDFIQEDPVPAPFTMEITLAQYDDEKAPEKADFLAETNQLGSGEQTEKLKPSSPMPLPVPAAYEQTPVTPTSAEAAPVNEQSSVLDTIKAPVKMQSFEEKQQDSKRI